MALSDYFYTDGTITVTNGSNQIVGVGTAWQLRHAVGSIVFVGTGFGFIASVEDETHATLTQVWAGPTSAVAAYTIWLVPSEAATNLANNQRLAEIIQSLDPAQPVNANLTAISNLVGALDMIMVFTGPGTFRLAAKSEFTSGVTYNAYVTDITGRAAYDLQTAGYGVMVANAPGDNMLANPGFEGGPANWSFLTGISLDTANQRTGINCAKLDKGVVGAGGTQRTLATGSSYPVVAGEAYTLAAWVKGSGVSTAGLALQVLWRDALNAPISTVNAVANVAFTASYAQYSGTLTAPPGAAFAYVAIAIATTATAQSIFVDDVSFHKQLSGRAALYVKNSATSGDWSLPSYITGPAGPLASITVGTVTSLNPGTPATVVNAGTPTAPVLNFGIPKGRGTNWKGDYSAGTAYIVDDTVLFNNSSWICIAPTTGNAPPALPTTTNTWWQLQAAKGVGDVNGPASSVAGNIAIFADATGKVLSDSGVPYRTALRNNLIVNPIMQISQENGATASTANAYYAADQWQHGYTTSGTISIGQVASITPRGSINRLRATVTALDATIAAGDFYCILQMIEGTRISNIDFGTASAKSLVLRFGFKGPAGTYSVALRNAAINRAYVKNFTVTAGQANTDLEFTFAIPGDVTGTWVTTVAAALSVAVFIACGTTFQGTDGVWQAGDIRGTAANTNGLAVNGAVYELFDVGLHPDPNNTGKAPEWVAPNYDEVLRDCFRYYEYITGLSVWGYVPSGPTGVNAPCFWKVRMRTAPTCTVLGWGGTANFNAQSISWQTDNAGMFGGTGVGAGMAYMIAATATANARM